MIRTISILAFVAIPLAVAGCDRSGAKEKPQVGTTQITGAEINASRGGERMNVGMPGPTDFQVMARGDIANLDKRLDAIEARLNAQPPEVQNKLMGELRETRGQRDALADDLAQLDGRTPGEVAARRYQLDSDWDALLTRVDHLSDAVPPPPANGNTAVGTTKVTSGTP